MIDGGNYIRGVRYGRAVKAEFECIVCGETATAAVDGEATPSDGEPLRTLRECPACEMETIRIET